MVADVTQDRLLQNLLNIEAIASASTTPNTLRNLERMASEAATDAFDVCGRLSSLELAASRACEALHMADEAFRDLGWHDKWEVTSGALDSIQRALNDRP